MPYAVEVSEPRRPGVVFRSHALAAWYQSIAAAARVGRGEARRQARRCGRAVQFRVVDGQGRLAEGGVVQPQDVDGFLFAD